MDFYIFRSLNQYFRIKTPWKFWKIYLYLFWNKDYLFNSQQHIFCLNTNYGVVTYSWENWLMRHQCTPSVHNEVFVGQIFYVICAYYPRTWFGVKWHIFTHVEDICDMLVRMSEYSLMWWYLFVRCYTIIMYDTIVRKYMKSDSLIFCHFLILLSI